MWLACMAFLLAVFYFIDRRQFARARHAPAGTEHRWRFEGLWNVAFLAVVVAAVFLQRAPLLGEGLMLAAAAASFFTTGRAVHEANQFSFRPMIEMAVLFFGIFATMMPALDLLRADQARLLWPRPFPVAGLLGFGNALGFSGQRAGLPGIFQRGVRHGRAGRLPCCGCSTGRIVAALSVATVLFGAVTYIGNGPNLMVKAIADHQKIPSPSFVAYLFKWAVPVMLPLLVMLWIVFFR